MIPSVVESQTRFKEMTKFAPCDYVSRRRNCIPASHVAIEQPFLELWANVQALFGLLAHTIVEKAEISAVYLASKKPQPLSQDEWCTFERGSMSMYAVDKVKKRGRRER